MDSYVYDCLMDGTYEDEELKPLMEVLSRITRFYQPSIVDSNLLVDDKFQEEQKRKREFLSELIPCFKKMVWHNNYQNIEEVLTYMFYHRIYWYDLVDNLNLIYFKEDMYQNKNKEYFEVIRSMCHRVNYGIDKNKLDFSIFSLIKYYEKYLNRMREYDPREWQKRIFFERFAPLIIGDFYINNYPLEELDRVLSRFVDEYEQVSSYFTFNGIKSKYSIDTTPEMEMSLVKNFIENNRIPRKVLR